MPKVYLDRTEFTGAISIFSKDTEIISAGATKYYRLWQTYSNWIKLVSYHSNYAT